MAQSRKKHSTVLKEFQKEIKRLEKFDSDNQTNFRTGKLSRKQLNLLTESIFFAAFRAYENFIRDTFLLYCVGKSARGQKKSYSFLQPKNYRHAEYLLQSGMPYLDWASPHTVIQRAELYLKQNVPIKLIYTSHLEFLRSCKLLRNHIAHNSKESLEGYKKVLRSHYGTIPLTLPPPGEFLLVSERRNASTYKLLAYLDGLNQVASDLI